ncbi:hypothetical protein, partial [Peribacillus frigoritolerans]|uniref:hypothetical protein n=1 Tax=Peribacillus frigoritolerans TaxID=450367 RepID=UPI0020C0C06E
KPQPSKLMMRVRFPSPAPIHTHNVGFRYLENEALRLNIITRILLFTVGFFLLSKLPAFHRSGNTVCHTQKIFD